MKAPTKLFLALIAGALIIGGAMVWMRLGEGPGLGKPRDVKVTIVCALPAEPWVNQAAKVYNDQKRSVDGARVTVEVIPMDGVTALSRWTKGAFDPVPTVWIAETRDWVNQANIAVAEATGQDIFLSGGEYRDQPVALSPEVWAFFGSRYDVLRENFGRDSAGREKLLSWHEIHEAALAGSWADMGGRPEWGRFKLVIPHPKRDPAGLAAMVGAAGAYFDKPSVSGDDLQDARFLAWLKQLLDTVVDFSPFGVENMLLFGYSNGDAGQIIESYLLVNMEGLQKRWKEPLVIVYPDPISWFDFPYATYMGKETSALEKNAALDFKRFLLSTEQQQAALKFGLRPANPDVPPRGEGSLIARWAEMGFLEQVPSASRMRQASRTGLNALTAWFQKQYEE